MTISLLMLVVVLAYGFIFALATAVERSARETAWRRIAEERRWNRDRGATPASPTVIPPLPHGSLPSRLNDENRTMTSR